MNTIVNDSFLLVNDEYALISYPKYGPYYVDNRKICYCFMKDCADNLEFFHQSKLIDTDFLSLGCVLAFSKDSDPDLLSYDESIIGELLNENRKFPELSLLAILFNFNDLLKTKVPDSNLTLAIRKLFSISFYLPQLLKINENKALKDIPRLIRILSTYYSDEKSIAITSSAGSLLIRISSYIRSVNLNSQIGQKLLEIVKSSMYLYDKILGSMDASIPLFHNCFLLTLQAFKCDTEYTEEMLSIFQKLVEIGAKAISDTAQFNYVALVYHLISLLDPSFKGLSNEIKLSLLIFVSKIISVDNESASIIKDDQALSNISSFIFDLLQSADLGNPEPLSSKFISDLKYGKNVVPPRSYIDCQMGYFQPNPIKSIYEQSFELPMLLPQFIQNPILNMATQACSSLCRSAGKGALYSFLNVITKGPKIFGRAVFVATFIRSVISSDFDSSIAELEEFHAAKILTEYAFSDFDNAEFSNFVINLFIFILSNKKESEEFIISVFNSLEACFSNLYNPKHLLKSICKLFNVHSGTLTKHLSKVFFDQRIANLIFMLQNMHRNSLQANDLETAEKVKECRYSLLRFVETFLESKSYTKMMFQSDIFVESLLQLAFEKGLHNFAVKQLSRGFTVLKAGGPTMVSIFDSFDLILKRAQTDQNFVPIGHSVIIGLSKFFKLNSVEIANVLLSTDIIMRVIHYIVATKSKEDMYLLLELAEAFSSMRGALREYMPDFNMFALLMPAVEVIFDGTNDTSLLEHLWAIALDGSRSLDEVHEVVNGTPLSLIYKIVKKNNHSVLEFLRYIKRCCEASGPSALEVNNSDFPSTLLDEIRTHRSDTEITEEFLEASYLFAFLSQYSVKSTDMLSLFQALTNLPSGHRPLYTVEFLSSLLLIFQSPYDAPSSFFHLSGTNLALRMPALVLEKPVKEFSVVFDIEFLRKPDGNLLMIGSEASRAFFSMWIIDGKLCFDMKSEKVHYGGELNYRFGNNTWSFVVITYDGIFIRLYVNGKMQSEGRVQGFEISEKIDKCYVTENVKCNIGMTALFDMCLPQKLVSLVWSLPRGVVTSFLPEEAENFPESFAPLFTRAFSDRIMLLFSGGVSDKGAALNLAGRFKKGVATIEGGNSFGYTPRARETLATISGGTVLLPLFVQLDTATLVNDGFDPMFLSFLMKFLCSFLGDLVNQQSFYQIDGFRILGALLSKISPRHFTLEVVDMLKKILQSIEYEPLFRTIIEDIYLNTQIWVYADPKVHSYVYSSLLDFLKSAQQEAKSIIAQVCDVSKIIFIIKSCMWEVYKTGLCLFDQPRVVNGVQYERPSQSLPLASIWKLAEATGNISFTKATISPLVYSAIDESDMDITFGTLGFIVTMLNSGNKEFIKLVSSELSFESFFPMLAKESEKLHVLCIHIFMMFSSLNRDIRDLFLGGSSFDEWIESITAVLNVQHNETDTADTIFGYIFGLFDNNRHLSCNISTTTRTQFRFANPSIIPIGLMVMSYMDDDVSFSYANAMDAAITEFPEDMKESKTIDEYLLIFLITQLPTPNAKVSRTSNFIINILAKYYSHSDKTSREKITVFLDIFAERVRADFSHIARLVMLRTVQYSFHVDVHPQSLETLTEILHSTFTYIFYVSEYSKYYLPFSSPKLDHPKMGFPELVQIKIGGGESNTKLGYTTRTDGNGVWEDAEIAEAFLQAVDSLPELLNPSKFFGSKSKNVLVMYSFVLAAGLRHSKHYYAFEKFIRPMTSRIPPSGSLNDSQIQAFTNYFSGLISVYMRTDRSHTSHVYLQEDTEFYNNIIKRQFGQKVQWGKSIDSFDGCFKSRGYHFAHIILEHFSAFEQTMIDGIFDIEQQRLKHLHNMTPGVTVEKFQRLNMMVANKQASMHRVQEQMKSVLMEYVANSKIQTMRGLKAYQNVARSVLSEGGPWHPPELKSEKHYKLDPTLQSSFRRGRMCENPNYVDHKDASIMRDTGSAPESQALYNEHLKRNWVIDAFPGSMEYLNLEDELEVEQRIENCIFKDEAKLITMRKLYIGHISLTEDHIVFSDESNKKYVRIEISSITDILLRHYLLMDTSVEIFSKQHRSAFIDFSHKAGRKRFIEVIKKKAPSTAFVQTSPSEIQQKLKETTKRWEKGMISNFDYLMLVNILAGRSYNDLSQYPVFPWVLSDYTSKELDLDNPAVYRDLSVPIGAMNKERFASMLDRMELADDESMRYHYGSLYSSSAVVIGFLIRVEPFTSLHIELQSGRFDISDRLFWSIDRCWQSVNITTMDFRELIPEFYYFPDFLVNSNGFDLGLGPRENGDVELPPWAESPADFVAKNRAALESPYVSEHLNEWIDLIFGVNSRGEGAKRANNIFNNNFFSSAITPQLEKDKAKLKFAQEYAACFGAAAEQVFDAPHPAQAEHFPPFDAAGAQFRCLIEVNESVIALSVSASAITMLTSGFTVLHHDRASRQTQINKISVGFPLTEYSKNRNRFVSISDRFVLASSPVDRALSLTDITQAPKLLCVRRPHSSRVTSTALGRSCFATADADGTILLWELNANGCERIPKAVITAHRAPVTAISICEESDIVASASQDGLIAISSSTNGRVIRVAETGADEPTELRLFKSGTVVAAFAGRGGSVLRAFDQQLRERGCVEVGATVSVMCAIEWGNGSEYVFVATKDQKVRIISLPSMGAVYERQKFDFEITSIIYDATEKELFAATQDGKVLTLRLRN